MHPPCPQQQELAVCAVGPAAPTLSSHRPARWPRAPRSGVLGQRSGTRARSAEDSLGHPGIGKAHPDFHLQNFLVSPAPITRCLDTFSSPQRSPAGAGPPRCAEAKGTRRAHQPQRHPATTQTATAADPGSCCCMLNGKAWQQKTKLRAAGIINAKTEAIMETFFRAPRSR